MGLLFEVFSAFAAQTRATHKARHGVLLGPVPYHPVLAVVFLTAAVVFALIAGVFAVYTAVVLTDDMMFMLGVILAPVAGMGVMAAIQFVLFALDYSKRG